MSVGWNGIAVRQLYDIRLVTPPARGLGPPTSVDADGCVGELGDAVAALDELRSVNGRSGRATSSARAGSRPGRRTGRSRGPRARWRRSSRARSRRGTASGRLGRRRGTRRREMRPGRGEDPLRVVDQLGRQIEALDRKAPAGEPVRDSREVAVVGGAKVEASREEAEADRVQELAVEDLDAERWTRPPPEETPGRVPCRRAEVELSLTRRGAGLLRRRELTGSPPRYRRGSASRVPGGADLRAAAHSPRVVDDPRVRGAGVPGARSSAHCRAFESSTSYASRPFRTGCTDRRRGRRGNDAVEGGVRMSRASTLTDSCV